MSAAMMLLTLVLRIPVRCRVVEIPCLLAPAPATNARSHPPADLNDRLAMVVVAVAATAAVATAAAVATPHAARAAGEDLMIPMAGATPTDLRHPRLLPDARENPSAIRSKILRSILFPRSVVSRSGRTSSI